MDERWLIIASMFVVVSAAMPLNWAQKALSASNLRLTIHWLRFSLASWLMVLACLFSTWPVWPMLHIGVSMTACAGVSVLGARSPGLGAWNFVTLGLLAVLLLPLIEQPWSAPHWSLDMPRAIFTGLVLAVGVVNYVPTRWGLLALLGGGALGTAVWLLAAPEQRASVPSLVVAGLVVTLALSVWGTWLVLRKRPSRGFTVDRLWLDFRNQFGLMWAKRVQEQFNQAARNAGYGERLTWSGITASKLAGAGELVVGREPQLLELLRAVLKKFGVGQAANT